MTEGTPVEVVNRQPPGRPEPAPLRVVHAVSEGAAVVAALVAGAIMLGIVIDVLFRTIFGGSVHGLLELVETFMVLVVYLGLAQAERTKTHVRMELLTGSLPVRIRLIIRSLAMLVATAGSGLFAYASFLRAVDSVQILEVRVGLLNFPIWPARIIVVVGFVLLLLESISRLYENLAALRKPEEYQEPTVTVEGYQ